jgi:hypothetical protein
VTLHQLLALDVLDAELSGEPQVGAIDVLIAGVLIPGPVAVSNWKSLSAGASVGLLTPR